MKNIQSKEPSNEEKLTALLGAYGEAQIVNALGVTIRSIYNYKAGSPVKERVQKRIDETFRKLQEGAEAVAGAEKKSEALAPDFQKWLNDKDEIITMLKERARAQADLIDSVERLKDLVAALAAAVPSGGKHKQADPPSLEKISGYERKELRKHT